MLFQETADENLLSARKLDQKSKDGPQIKALLFKEKTETQLQMTNVTYQNPR